MQYKNIVKYKKKYVKKVSTRISTKSAKIFRKKRDQTI